MKLLGFLAFHLLLNLCEAGRDFYTAAVLEKRDETDATTSTPQEVVQASLDLYKRAAEMAAHKEVDIIVFSEFGIFPYMPNRTFLQGFAEYVPDPKTGHHNPCNDKEQYSTRTILLTLSCMAKRHKMYVVANMLDIQEDKRSQDEGTCDADGTDANCEPKRPTYNTNVAFNREGDLIARYHKHNLYFEMLDTATNQSYFETFQTDFGLFGLIVCFDSTFKYTADLVQTKKIDTLLFLTHWFDDIVPLNGIEWQQAMALGHGVNVLGANGHRPGNGTLGSGIFSKTHGALRYTYNPDGRSKLVIAKVPHKKERITPAKSSTALIDMVSGEEIAEEKGKDFPQDGYLTTDSTEDIFTEYHYFKSQTEHYSIAKLEGSKNKLSICSPNRMCCTLKYEADMMVEDYYLAVFNGTNDVRGYFKWQEEMCQLVRCNSFENRPCTTQPSIAKTVFKYVKLSSTTFTSPTIFPTVSTTNHRLAPKTEWDFARKGNRATLSYVGQSGSPLLKVALYGRNYPMDPINVPYYKY